MIRQPVHRMQIYRNRNSVMFAADSQRRSDIISITDAKTISPPFHVCLLLFTRIPGSQRQGTRGLILLSSVSYPSPFQPVQLSVPYSKLCQSKRRLEKMLVEVQLDTKQTFLLFYAQPPLSLAGSGDVTWRSPRCSDNDYSIHSREPLFPSLLQSLFARWLFTRTSPPVTSPPLARSLVTFHHSVVPLHPSIHPCLRTKEQV